MTTMQIAAPGRRAAGRALAHLDALTVTQRQVFVLHGASGLSVGETARRTGLARAAVRAIFTGAAQRLADTTATPAPEVFRRSPKNSSDRTNNPPEQGLCEPAQESPCPPWCDGRCRTEADGARFHLSNGTVTDFHEGGQPDVYVSRLDDDGQPGTPTVELSLLFRDQSSLTPEQALALADVLRAQSLIAAGPAGVEMPAEQARVGDEILTANGWQPVESLLLDGTAEHVAIYTSDGDDTGHAFTTGDLVRVRQAATS